MRDSPIQILRLAHLSPVPWNPVIKRTADILSVPPVYYRDRASRPERVGDDDDSNGESPSTFKLRLLDFPQRANLFGLLGSPGVSSEIVGFPRVSEMRGIVGEVGEWLRYWNMPEFSLALRFCLGD